MLSCVLDGTNRSGVKPLVHPQAASEAVEIDAPKPEQHSGLGSPLALVPTANTHSTDIDGVGDSTQPPQPLPRLPRLRGHMNVIEDHNAAWIQMRLNPRKKPPHRIQPSGSIQKDEVNAAVECGEDFAKPIFERSVDYFRRPCELAEMELRQLRATPASFNRHEPSATGCRSQVASRDPRATAQFQNRLRASRLRAEIQEGAPEWQHTAYTSYVREGSSLPWSWFLYKHPDELAASFRHLGSHGFDLFDHRKIGGTESSLDQEPKRVIEKLRYHRSVHSSQLTPADRQRHVPRYNPLGGIPLKRHLAITAHPIPYSPQRRSTDRMTSGSISIGFG